MARMFLKMCVVFSSATLGVSAYGVESPGIQAALGRYKVVGVISEESPRKPLTGIAVLKDVLKGATHTLTIGDPLPEDPDLSVVSTKSGQVVISNGREEFTLEHTETEVEAPPSEGQGAFSEVTGKWEENVSVLANPTLLGKEKRLLVEQDLDLKNGIGSSPVSPPDDKLRFPFYKVDSLLNEADAGREVVFDPFAELETFSQDWEWSPASEWPSSDLNIPDPEAPPLLEGASTNPWWVGEDEARSVLRFGP